MNLLFNAYDLGLWLVIAALTWRYGRLFGEWYHGCGLALFAFGLVLPMISVGIASELAIVRRGGDAAMDSWETAYTVFRFPVYWVLGIAWSVWVAILVRRGRRLGPPVSKDIVDDSWE